MTKERIYEASTALRQLRWMFCEATAQQLSRIDMEMEVSQQLSIVASVLMDMAAEIDPDYEF